MIVGRTSVQMTPTSELRWAISIIPGQTQSAPPTLQQKWLIAGDPNQPTWVNVPVVTV